MYLALLARERFTVKLRNRERWKYFRDVHCVLPNHLCTVAHNCHIKTKCSHQIQVTHIKFKSLTSNSDHSQQIQITHSKLQITHSKLQIVHIKYKSFTSNTNRSHQIQIAHSKYKYGR